MKQTPQQRSHQTRTTRGTTATRTNPPTETQPNSNRLKVGSQSDPHKVAGSIAACIKEHGRAVLTMIGAGALNQMVKAGIIAQGYLAPEGYSLWYRHAFTNLNVDGAERTAIRITVIGIKQS
ncbi:stage V sporulation protein S [Patescibacteria group bacterium]|nr:stage V sporulation protein S [Patescibacteria group bacterium]